MLSGLADGTSMFEHIARSQSARVMGAATPEDIAEAERMSKYPGRTVLKQVVARSYDLSVPEEREAYTRAMKMIIEGGLIGTHRVSARVAPHFVKNSSGAPKYCTYLEWMEFAVASSLAPDANNSPNNLEGLDEALAAEEGNIP